MHFNIQSVLIYTKFYTLLKYVLRQLYFNIFITLYFVGLTPCAFIFFCCFSGPSCRNLWLSVIRYVFTIAASAILDVSLPWCYCVLAAVAIVTLSTCIMHRAKSSKKVEHVLKAKSSFISASCTLETHRRRRYRRFHERWQRY